MNNKSINSQKMIFNNKSICTTISSYWFVWIMAFHSSSCSFIHQSWPLSCEAVRRWSVCFSVNISPAGQVASSSTRFSLAEKIQMKPEGTINDRLKWTDPIEDWSNETSRYWWIKLSCFDQETCLELYSKRVLWFHKSKLSKHLNISVMLSFEPDSIILKHQNITYDHKIIGFHNLMFFDP